MGEKIFGEIQKTEELNELANNLRKSKEFEEIRLLCSENNISPEVAEKFIKGDLLILAEIGHLEGNKSLQSPTWKAARADIKEFQSGLIKHTDLVAERIRKGLLISTEKGQAPESQPEPGTQPEKPEQVYSIEDVKKKLEAELKIYRDGDSKYVIEKLIELCRSDRGLLDAVMLPHKSYDKAFQYFYERSRTVGYKMPHGNMVYLDNDRAVELSVEYFKKDDDAEAKRRSEKKKDQPKPRQQPQPQNKPDVKAQKKESKKAEPKETMQIVPEMNKAKQEPKPKKNEMNGQLSLFDF